MISVSQIFNQKNMQLQKGLEPIVKFSCAQTSCKVSADLINHRHEKLLVAAGHHYGLMNPVFVN